MVVLFVPACNHSVCEERLWKLTDLLSDEGYTIFENVFTGSKASFFKESIEKSSFTILHKCPVLWNFIRIADLDTFLRKRSDLYTKLLCVEFGGLAFNSLVHDPPSFQRFEQFFEDLNVQEISTDLKVTRFVLYVQKILSRTRKRSDSSTRPKTALLRSQGSVSARSQMLSENVESKERKFLQKLHDLREKQVKRSSKDDGSLVQYSSDYTYVFAKVIGGREESTRLLNINRLTTFDELKEHINDVLCTNETALCNLQFLIHKALPELYSSDMLLGLVTIATCDELDLQKHALNLIERLVLKGKLHAPDTGFELLVTLKVTLIDSIDLMRSDQPKLSIEKYITVTQSFLNLPVDEVRQFLEDLQSPSSRRVSDINSLMSQRDYKQFYVLVQQFKRMFTSGGDEDMQCLDYIEAYLTYRPGLTGRSPPPLCIELIQRGILQFLSYISKESVKQSIAVLCRKTLRIISLLKHKNNLSEISRSLNSLMFYPNDVIRQQIIDFFENDKDLKESVEQRSVHFLQEMFPTLSLDPEDVDKVSSLSVKSWFKLPGHFIDKPIKLFVHKPSRNDHYRNNKTDFVAYKDLMKLRNIKMLRNLQHENVVTLYAYNIDSIPEFFVIEKHWEKQCKNLQHYLVNRRLTKRWCSVIILNKFVCEAGAAVEFCHSRNIILRDITAASFIVTKDNSVKLCRFYLAMDLGTKVEIQDEIGDHFLLPTRWSASESLWRYRWSKKSDVWMFGTFIYEVLTHGLLPYTQVNITDVELKLQMRLGTIKLQKEDCISDLYEDILSCTDNLEANRPTMSQITDSLMRHKKSKKYNMITFPKLADGQYKTSTNFSKGIPKLYVNEFAGVYFQFHRDLSVNSKQYTDMSQQTNRHLFQQKVKRQFSQPLHDLIKKGSLDGIVPIINITQANEIHDDNFKINIRIPLHLDGNILELVLNKTLGKSDANFKHLLLKIAKLLYSLHKLNLVLGIVRASQLFVHRVSEHDYKIFPVALGCLQYLDSSQTVKCETDQLDSTFNVRSAPEVIESKRFSTSSDVFNLGVVMLDLFQARLEPQQPDVVSNCSSLKDFDALESKIQLTSVEKPKKMNPKIFKLIMKCLNENSELRPTMADVIRALSPKEESFLTRSRFAERDALFSIPTNVASLPPRTGEEMFDLNVLNESEQGSWVRVNSAETDFVSIIGTEYFDFTRDSDQTLADEQENMAQGEESGDLRRQEHNPEQPESREDNVSEQGSSERFNSAGTEYVSIIGAENVNAPRVIDRTLADEQQTVAEGTSAETVYDDVLVGEWELRNKEHNFGEPKATEDKVYANYQTMGETDDYHDYRTPLISSRADNIYEPEVEAVTLRKKTQAQIMRSHQLPVSIVRVSRTFEAEAPDETLEATPPDEIIPEVVTKRNGHRLGFTNFNHVLYLSQMQINEDL
uniref:Protein kinase domain-containing protein n=1 Tax=Biomphalaria glabrata TaxID=6526 RepID=A0A2C9L230_BIOGL